MNQRKTSKFKIFLCAVISGFFWYGFVRLIYYGFIAYNPTDSFMDPIMQGVAGGLAFVCFIIALVFTYLAYRWYKG
jgi:hypothetical protein